MAQLNIQQLCKGWDFPVIDRLDLSVDEGEFFVIVGPSGIGKTTLLRLVAGLEQPDAGTIRVGERDLSGVPPYHRRVAMTFESYALYPHLTVFENIASPLRARRVDAETIQRKVTEIAELLRIEQLLQRRPGEVSGGQKQRTALGRTLVAEPEVFLLDEPLSHLDAKIRHDLRQQFHQLQELRRVATLYVTHDYAEALSLGDRIGVMGPGGLVQVGSAREVFQQPKNLFVAQHLGQPSVNVIAAQLLIHNQAMHAEATLGRLRFPVAPAHVHRLSSYQGDGLILGLRPQHLRVLDPDQPSDLPVVEARVELFEALGAVGVLVADLEGLKLTAISSPEHHFTPGQPVQLALDSDSALYFHPSSGDNLML